VLLPRSSIAAVLQHRGDLDLTDAQLQRLQARDDALEQQQAPLRDAAAKPLVAKAAQATPDSAPAPSGRHGSRHRNPTPDAKPVGQTPQEQLDDNDTRAYLEAEAEVLTEKQRDPAREVASKYREDLYDQRSRAQGSQ
jgi:hypothetical protein